MKKIRLALCLLVTGLCTWLSYVPSYAAEVTKDVQVTIPNDYVQCSFYATFDKDINADTILVTPNGDRYPFTDNIGGEGLKCTIKKVKAGTYHVIATLNPDAGDNPAEETQETDDTSPDAIEDTDTTETADDIPLSADELIGKITVTVKAEEESADVVSQNIKIAKEIDGLQIYWKDDSIVATWEDESVGNVNVTVMDSKTLQILGSRKVKDKYFELEIDQSIEEIIISIVPSESSTIDGAGNEYVKKVSNHPEATVSIEPYEYTNLDAIPIKVSLFQPYSLLYTINEENVGGTDVLEPGEYDLEVPTVLGENNLKVYVVDSEHNMRSTGISFTKDMEPPILKITNDIAGTKTYDSNIHFEGTVEDYDKLMFRNDSVFVDWDGTFSIDASLKEGENELVLTATDLAGNEATYTAIVTRLVKEQKTIPWNLIFLFLGILLITILFFIKKKCNITIHTTKRKNHNKRNSSLIGSSEKADYIFYVICIAVYLILIKYVFQVSVVQSGSMEPTINTKEVILLDKVAYLVKEPRRGDIITFNSKEKNSDMLKRIIGMPGDTISFVDGYVFVNGTICDESAYLEEDVETNCLSTFTVPEGCYFLLGDNRYNSDDSRFWENPYIAKSDIIGKLLLHVDFKQ